MITKVRPSGVTVMVVLEILGGLALLGFGAMFVILSSFMSGFGSEFSGGYSGLMGPLAALSSVIGAVLVVMGIINFIIAIGLWRGSGWARTLGLVFSAIGIILGLISLPSGIISIIIDAVIIYYLTRPHVIQFFSMSSTASATPSV